MVRGLDPELSHQCRLIVTMPDRRADQGGVVALIEQGEIASVSSDLTIHSPTFASGTPSGWVETLIDPSRPQLSVGGDLEVLGDLLHGLHELLYAD